MFAVQVLALFILLVVATIYLYLFYRKQAFIYTSRISKNLEKWISTIVMEESLDNVVLPKRFYHMMTNALARQYVIDELIGCKKNFSGLAGENIKELYLELGLKAESVKKMKHGNGWHIKAKGIQELYTMGQTDMLPAIYKLTNSSNEFVRMEAQTAIIHLSGFPGLRFLDVISYPLTEWQQLKLLEQLKLTPIKEDLTGKIPHWLASKNDTVVIFALKLADEYQLYHLKSQVIACLVHPIASVRSQGLKTLVRIADESAPSILLGYLNKEDYMNQAYILDALQYLATDREKPFLLQLLDYPNEKIKLKAAIVIAKCCTDGLEMIKQRALTQPVPFGEIFLHVTEVVKT
ncbi:MAG: hypothetical protein RLZZ28_2034 [Bacteroidota bacterium]